MCYIVNHTVILPLCAPAKSPCAESVEARLFINLSVSGLGEHAAARDVLERDLLWLLDRDPATLGADQRQAREYVAQVVRDNQSRRKRSPSSKKSSGKKK